MMTIEARAIELWDVNQLIPYDKNAKKHEPASVTKLARSIKEFGWDQPIVVDIDGVIIKGHGRRLAAIELGMKKVPVIVRDDLSKTQADALRLSDNQVVSTEYDMSALNDELQRLMEEGGFDTSAIGFDERELESINDNLDEMTDDFFVDDVGAAVEKQREENERAAEEADDIAAPVADALGFKRVTIAQSRQIRDYMGRIEGATGKTGVEALLQFFDDASSVLKLS